MIWEVFRQEDQGGYHTHCGNVHAPDRKMAKQFAAIQHGRRKPTNSIWVVPKNEIGELDADETSFGGVTDKSYRWAPTYKSELDHAAEVIDSEGQQAEAEKQRGEI